MFNQFIYISAHLLHSRCSKVGVRFGISPSELPQKYTPSSSPSTNDKSTETINKYNATPKLTYEVNTLRLTV